MNRFRKILLAAASMLPAMAYAQQIPLLPQAATPLSGKEIAVIVQGGITKQVGIASISGTATLPTIAANTLLGNSTSAPAPTFALALPNCGGGLQALTYTAGNGFGCNTISTTATAGGQNGQFQINNNGALAGTPSLTISGTTITGPDGTTWAPSGLANSANFTTAGTSLLSLTPNVSYSGAGNFAVNTVSPIVTPTNVAFNGYTNGLSIGNTLGSGTAINVLTMRAMSTGLVIQAGYTGTVAAGIDFLANTPTLNGANAYTNFVEFLGGGISNGSGLTTGAVANFGLQIQAPTAVAGVGGALTNTGVSIALAAGTNAGTVINTGLSISGNGQTGGAVTNWAINSTSTAPSQFAGPMALNGTVSGTGITSLFGAPPPIGSTTPSTGVFSGIGVNVNSTGTGILTIQESGAQQVKLNNSAGTTEAFIGTIGATGAAPTNALRIRGDAGISFGTGGAQAALINTSNVLAVFSGLANSVNLAGSATNPTIGTSAGGLTISSSGGNITLGGTSVTVSALTVSTDVCTDSSKNLTSACGTNGGSGAVQTISYQPGTLTSITATKSVFGKFVKASTLRNLELSALLFSCTTNPTITLYECGTSATCATPTTMASGTITTTGTVVDGTISSAAIAAGDYVAWGISAGVCVSLDASGTAQIQAN